MTELTYLQQRANLLDDCLRSDRLYEHKIHRRTVNLVSAGLLNFLPSIPVSAHDQFFRQIEFHQQLALLDSQHDDPLQRVSYEGPMAESIQLMKTRPAIICTHHMGSSKLINYVLGLHNIPYSIVIGQNELQASGTIYQSLIDQYQADIQLISAHEPTAGIRMIKALRQGRGLLVYIDGNTGTGDDSIRNENRQKIAFLSESIYARKGTALLAHVANVPLIQVISYRETMDEIRLRFEPPIYPDKTRSKDDFSKVAIQQLYDSFSVVLQQYPEQWECWKYLHAIINPQEFNQCVAGEPKQVGALGQRLQFNSGLFGLLDIDDSYFLFNKRTYGSFPITTPIYSFLLASLRREADVSQLDGELVRTLYQHHVLTAIPDAFASKRAVA